MAESQIHELAQIVAVSGSTLLVASDGTNTFKATVSQIPMDLPVRTTEDPDGVEGSIRANVYNPSTSIGWNPSALGRSGIVWHDAGTEWHSLLEARDIGRRIYRRLVSATAASYTLTEEDVMYGMTIIYSGTDAKRVYIPGMTSLAMPTETLPTHGTLGVRRCVSFVQAGSGAIELLVDAGLSNLYGTVTTNGDNSRLDLEYDTRSEARAWRVA